MNLESEGRNGSPSCLFKSLRILFDARGYSGSSSGCVALGSALSSVPRLRELFLRSLEGLVALSAGDSSVMLGDAVSPRSLGDGVPDQLSTFCGSIARLVKSNVDYFALWTPRCSSGFRFGFA